MRHADQNIANAWVVRIRRAAGHKAGRDCADRRANAGEGRAAKAPQRQRRATAHSIEQQPPGVLLDHAIRALQLDLHTHGAAGIRHHPAKRAAIQHHAAGRLQLAPRQAQQRVRVERNIQDIRHPQLGRPLARPGVEAHHAAVILGHDDLAQLIPAAKANLDQRAQLIARDIPLAVRAADLAAIKQQHAVAVARHHHRVQQPQAAAGVDQVVVGRGLGVGSWELGVDIV